MKGLDRRGRITVTMVAAFAIAVVGMVVYSARTGQPAPKFRLLSAVPASYQLDPAATGSMSRDAAADSTVMPADALRSRLEAAQFVVGESKTWRSGERFIEVAAYRFRSAEGARSMMQWQLDYAALLSPGPQVVGPIKDVPGAKTFYVAGEQDSDGNPLFSWGAWFTRGDTAYLVQIGGTQPDSSQFVTELTRRQFDLVS